MAPKKRTASPARASPAKNASVSASATSQPTQPNYEKLFTQLDKDHSGYLEFDELYAALVTHHNAPPHITPMVVMNMMQEADIDGNGLIDLKEFIVIMSNAQTSKYWKLTSNSLWGSFNAAILNGASIAESILQPVHEAVNMHAHPQITDGNLKEMSPSAVARIGFFLIALFLGFLEPFVPCFAWTQGKTLPAFLAGYHFRKKSGKVCGFCDMLLLLVVDYAIFGGISSVLAIPILGLIACPTLFIFYLLFFLFNKHNQSLGERILGYRPVMDMSK
jgi:hypothetical protein